MALKVYSDFIKVSCAPVIYDSTYTNVSPKAIEVVKYIKGTSEKVVVFAKFLEFHEILQDYLKKAGVSFVSLTGVQTPREKDKAKTAFNSDPEVQVILLTGAGKFGLNIQVSNTIVFVDMPYTPADVFQYIGRIYRTGQERDCNIEFFYSSNSLEEDLFASLERKQSEIDEFFGTSDADIFKLSIDTNIDVKKSFLARNYLEGAPYESIATPADWAYVPEKRIVASKRLDKEEELTIINI